MVMTRLVLKKHGEIKHVLRAQLQCSVLRTVLEVNITVAIKGLHDLRSYHYSSTLIHTKVYAILGNIMRFVSILYPLYGAREWHMGCSLVRTVISGVNEIDLLCSHKFGCQIVILNI